MRNFTETKTNRNSEKVNAGAGDVAQLAVLSVSMYKSRSSVTKYHVKLGVVVSVYL